MMKIASSAARVSITDITQVLDDISVNYHLVQGRMVAFGVKAAHGTVQIMITLKTSARSAMICITASVGCHLVDHKRHSRVMRDLLVMNSGATVSCALDSDGELCFQRWLEFQNKFDPEHFMGVMRDLLNYMNECLTVINGMCDACEIISVAELIERLREQTGGG
ncbi:hypothetical protein HYW17_00855 [Candidatus Uhrbacteria bacterium]|nr:hypothetical protein [Candidatus Uhrbacteria bacterium]